MEYRNSKENIVKIQNKYRDFKREEMTIRIGRFCIAKGEEHQKYN
jgi:hypothetical protein